MVEVPRAGIYLIVEFEWPQPFTAVQGKMARQLHDAVQDQSWIKDVVAASGGIGTGPGSIWIFWLENYAALDTLLNDETNAISQAYTSFFTEMPVVQDKIRGEVVFL